MRDLRASAAEFPEAAGDDGTDRFFQVMQRHLPALLRDQVMLNDPGTSLFLIDGLAQSGWTGWLRFLQGEVYRLRNQEGDRHRASDAYAMAVAMPDAPPEAWRAHGYSLITAGQLESGRVALSRYLEAMPDAPDAEMVRFTIEAQRGSE